MDEQFYSRSIVIHLSLTTPDFIASKLDLNPIDSTNIHHGPEHRQEEIERLPTEGSSHSPSSRRGRGKEGGHFLPVPPEHNYVRHQHKPDERLEIIVARLPKTAPATAAISRLHNECNPASPPGCSGEGPCPQTKQQQGPTTTQTSHAYPYQELCQQQFYQT